MTSSHRLRPVVPQKKIYLIKEEALRNTLEEALRLKKDKENVSTFTDRYNNQMFFVLTEEQFRFMIEEKKKEGAQAFWRDWKKYVLSNDLKKRLEINGGDGNSSDD